MPNHCLWNSETYSWLCGLDSSDSGLGQIACFSAPCNKSQVWAKTGKMLDSLRSVSFLRRVQLHSVI